MNYTCVILLFCCFFSVFGQSWLEYTAAIKNIAIVLVHKRVEDNSEVGKAIIKAINIRPDVKFIVVSCLNLNIEVCKNIPPEQFPIIRYFTNGIEADIYMGLPELSTLLPNFFPPSSTASPPTRLIPASVTKLTTVTDFENLLKKDEATVIGAFEEKTNLEGIYLNVAEEQQKQGQDKTNFAHTSADEILKILGTKNGIVAYPRKHIELSLKPIIYNGTETEAEVKSFVVSVLSRDASVSGIEPSCGVKIYVLQITILVTACVGFCF